MELHPQLEPLSGLLGTWVGPGHGAYPTIASFDYEEELRFDHIGKPFLVYSQRTRAADDGRPLHSETGYWRLTADGSLELLLAHTTGHSEVAVGTVDDGRIATRGALVGAPSAKEVTAIERHYVLTDDTLRCDLRMDAVGQGMTDHLRSELHRR